MVRDFLLSNTVFMIKGLSAVYQGSYETLQRQAEIKNAYVCFLVGVVTVERSTYLLDLVG